MSKFLLSATVRVKSLMTVLNVAAGVGSAPMHDI